MSVEFVRLRKCRVALRAGVLPLLVVLVHLVLLQVELGGEVFEAHAARKVPHFGVHVVHVRTKACESGVDPALGAEVALLLRLDWGPAHKGPCAPSFPPLLLLWRLVLTVIIILKKK